MIFLQAEEETLIDIVPKFEQSKLHFICVCARMIIRPSDADGSILGHAWYQPLAAA